MKLSLTRISALFALLSCCFLATGCDAPLSLVKADDPSSPSAPSATKSAKSSGGISGDCPQWCGTQGKNNVRVGKNVPDDWDVGEFDDETGVWKGGGQNIKWVARAGSQTYGNVVVANGKLYVGTNNGNGWVKRFPADVDLGCLICFNLDDGKFLWQHSNRKLKAGRVVDWPYQGICCAPLVENNRLWYVTSRGTVACLDTDGFYDDENDKPYEKEEVKAKNEADVIWEFDLMGELGVFQHNMCSCSVTTAGDILFVNTSNGVDASHVNLPSPKAPSFVAMDKNTGKVLWTDNSPGTNILHGQWSSPTYGVLGGVPQVLFAGGDGWLYSFHGASFKDGKPKLLWKFDCNPKESLWELEGKGTRNNLIATPVIYDQHVYIAVGQDPEHGEGNGHLWCIDPTKRGDVSAQLAVHVDDRKKPIPHRRLQAVKKKNGEVAIDNPNSAAVWHYGGADLNGDGKLKGFEELMHRSCGTVAIKDDILCISDFSGLLHCLDAKTGKRHWHYDMLAAAWGSPLITEGKVYVGDEDGDVSIFKLSADPKVAMNDGEPHAEINMGSAVYTSPVLAHNILYIASRNYVFAISNKEK